VGELYKRYTHLIYGVCLKYLKIDEDARDMSLEIFEKLLGILLQHKVEHFKGWIYQVVRNQCLMHLRKKQSVIKHEREYKETTLSSVESSFEMHLFSEDEKTIDPETVQQAIKMLKPGQRECIDLFYIKRHSYKEVVDKTGFTIKEVKSYIQNGKRNLKTILQNQNGIT
jgi:RNA polymerase sigma-70 factor (ECF subfamily)